MFRSDEYLAEPSDQPASGTVSSWGWRRCCDSGRPIGYARSGRRLSFPIWALSL